jgi:hypothetical protein
VIPLTAKRDFSSGPTRFRDVGAGVNRLTEARPRRALSSRMPRGDTAMTRPTYTEWTTPDDDAESGPFADRAVRERIAALIAAAALTPAPRTDPPPAAAAKVRK